jgi:hypothetical protein
MTKYLLSIKLPPIFSDLASYDWGPFPAGLLGLSGDMNHTNASLALQLTNFFLQGVDVVNLLVRRL